MTLDTWLDKCRAQVAVLAMRGTPARAGCTAREWNDDQRLVRRLVRLANRERP